MVQHHADRPFMNLQCKLVRRLAHRRPFLSGVRASGNPGAVHLVNINEPAEVAIAEAMLSNSSS